MPRYQDSLTGWAFWLSLPRWAIFSRQSTVMSSGYLSNEARGFCTCHRQILVSNSDFLVPLSIIILLPTSVFGVCFPITMVWQAHYRCSKSTKNLISPIKFHSPIEQRCGLNQEHQPTGLFQLKHWKHLWFSLSFSFPVCRGFGSNKLGFCLLFSFLTCPGWFLALSCFRVAARHIHQQPSIFPLSWNSSTFRLAASSLRPSLVPLSWAWFPRRWYRLPWLRSACLRLSKLTWQPVR